MNYLFTPWNRDLLKKWFGLLILALAVPFVWAKVYLIVLLLGTYWFFREPGHIPAKSKPGSNVVTGPCYGRVTDIQSDKDGHHLSIFLSVFDPHAQYAPISGTITKKEYIHGEFHPAQFFAKTRLNERSTTTFVSGSHETFHVTQIAGLIARRILSFLPEGSRVSQGDPFGMIRFGSRVDISIPRSYTLQIKRGDYVHGPSTVLAMRPIH